MDEIIIREAEYWCALNNVDIENIDDEDLYQCITSIANVYTVDGKYYNLLYVKNHTI